MFCSLFGCAQVFKPDSKWKRWTVLRTPNDRTIAIKAALSINGVFDALPATVKLAEQDSWDHLAVVVDLNGGTIDDRRNAVAGRLGGTIPPMVSVVGIGDANSILQVVDGKNLDQVVARILLSGNPSLQSPIQDCLAVLRRAKCEPNWKVVTSLLAGLMSEEFPEALFRRAIIANPDHARQVLDELGLLEDFAKLV